MMDREARYAGGPGPEGAASVLSTEGLLNRALADLPTVGVRDGATAWVSDGRKTGEGSAAGTGLLAYFNTADSSWRRFYDDGAVTT